VSHTEAAAAAEVKLYSQPGRRRYALADQRKIRPRPTGVATASGGAPVGVVAYPDL